MSAFAFGISYAFFSNQNNKCSENISEMSVTGWGMHFKYLHKKNKQQQQALSGNHWAFLSYQLSQCQYNY